MVFLFYPLLTTKEINKMSVEPSYDYDVPLVNYTDGLFLDVPDLENEFNRLEIPPRIINDYPVATKEQRNRLNELLVTEYSGDTLGTIPSCECGAPEYTGGEHLGKICHICHTIVANVTDRPIQPSFWMRVPDGVRGFILPAFWGILTASFCTKQTCILSWLINTNYRPRANNSKTMNRLRALNLPRGLNEFIDNFDMIMDTLIEKNFFKAKEPYKLHVFREYITENRDLLFPKVLPLPPSLNFIKESTPTGTYTDETIKFALDAVWTICSLYSPGATFKPRVVQNRTFSAVTQLVEYYTKLWPKSLASKPALIRKHICGGRPDYTFRSVITSIHGIHDHRELHVPWALGITLFKQHLLSMLLREGYVYNDAVKLIMDHTLRYSSKLHNMLNSIIHSDVEHVAATPYNLDPIQPISGASVIFQRNPSLVRLSAQNLFITRIKTDMNDFTIGLSVLVLKGPNADFDGDQLNGMLMLDDVFKRAAMRLAPSMGIIDAGRVRGISHTSILPKPTLSTISNYMGNIN